MYNNNLYIEDINNAIENIVGIEKLRNKIVFVTGASGLMGSFIVDVFRALNKQNYNISIIVNGRSEEKLRKRFLYMENDLIYLAQDVTTPFSYDGPIDYIIHAASNCHPRAYVEDPMGIVMSNVVGTDNLLSLAKDKHAKMLFISSAEVYGENRNGLEKYSEGDMGYINCNDLRACYNESKRCGETLCQCYHTKYNVEVVIVRPARIYGPTVQETDTKASSQFIKNALAGENIVLKSAGTQRFSYLHVADTVSGILTVLLNGKSCESYNIADEKSDVMLKDLAKIVADKAGTEVVFDIPEGSESVGFSRTDMAILDATKLKTELGWKAKYDIKTGFERTIDILKSI